MRFQGGGVFSVINGQSVSYYWLDSTFVPTPHPPPRPQFCVHL